MAIVLRCEVMGESVSPEPRRVGLLEALEKRLPLAERGLSFKGWWRRSQLAMEKRICGWGSASSALRDGRSFSSYMNAGGMVAALGGRDPPF